MRKFHRWVSLPACLFLLMVAATGVVLQVQQFISADEAERERLADKPSEFALSGGAASLEDAHRAEAKLLSVADAAMGAGGTIDRVDHLLRADPPRVVLHAITKGGTPLRFTAKASDGSLIGPEGGEEDQRESFMLRLHTGEIFGDAGVVFGMIWGTALVALTLTGVWMYYRMWSARRRSLGAAVQRGAAGVKKPRFGGLFWMLALGVVLIGAPP